ncbi:MAG: rhodanese-like domain-containing protein [Mycoplasmatales bacterium]
MKKILFGLITAVVIILMIMISLGMASGYFLGYEKISANELPEFIEANENYKYVDVRNSEDYQSGHIMGFSNIEATRILADSSIINNNGSIVLISQEGKDSKKVAKYLTKQGYTVIDVLGGIAEYSGTLTT